jgi:hypothetical protein
VFCASTNESVFRTFVFAERIVTGKVYLDMLEEFLKPILSEEVPCDMLFQQDSTFPQENDGLLKSQVSREMDWQGRISLSHLDRPTFLPFIISFGLCTCHHWLPLCRNLLGG